MYYFFLSNSSLWTNSKITFTQTHIFNVAISCPMFRNKYSAHSGQRPQGGSTVQIKNMCMVEEEHSENLSPICQK